MNLLHNLLVAVQIISALVMIGLVLIQHGKGADMGASFGSGASGSLFGATGSANFLSRSTAVCAAVFFACTLTLAFFANDRASRPAGGGSSVLEGAAAPAASVPAAGAALVPGAASAPAAAAPAPAATASSGAGAVPSK
ncbi:MAG: preprotein translocase subunit SecG [Piscinibacter sp.]